MLDGEAAALINQAITLNKIGRTDEALTAGERAVAHFREKGDTRLEAAALVNLCVVLMSAGRFNEVIAAARRSCSLAEIAGDRRGQPFYYLGKALLKTGRVAEAIDVLQQAVVTYRSTGRGDYENSGRPWMEADALEELGIALWAASRYEDAIIASKRAADLYQMEGHHSGERGVLVNLCVYLTRARKFDEAISTCKRLIERCQQSGDEEREAAAQANLGAALFESGRAEEAIEPCEQAAELARRAGNSGTEASALMNLGNVLQELGRHQEAIIPYKRAAQELQRSGDSKEIVVLQNLSVVALRALQFNDGIAALERMVSLAGETGDRAAERAALTSLRTLARHGYYKRE